MIPFLKANMLDAFKDVKIQSFKSNTENSKTESTTDSESVSILDEYIKNFAKSFSKSEKPDETLDNESKYVLNLVDKDKNGMVTIDELKSFDSSTIASESETKIKDIEENFKTYDQDHSGDLSFAEIKNALGQKQYSLQELRAMANENKTENQDQVAFDEPSYSFYQKALDNYKKANSNFAQ